MLTNGSHIVDVTANNTITTVSTVVVIVIVMGRICTGIVGNRVEAEVGVAVVIVSEIGIAISCVVGGSGVRITRVVGYGDGDGARHRRKDGRIDWSDRSQDSGQWTQVSTRSRRLADSQTRRVSTSRSHLGFANRP